MTKIRMGLRLLETLTSALYDDPIILFREYVQNSVDAYNESVDADKSRIMSNFAVEIFIDKINKAIKIVDNGYGISPSKFADKMTGIGSSTKANSLNQIGFRGIGRLSAMPFCDRLKFINKASECDTVQSFEWNGSKFHDLLNQDDDDDLESAINRISELTTEKYNGNKSDHCFIVEIHNYNIEIDNSISKSDFIPKLKMMLPLKYHPNFSQSSKVSSKYLEFMGSPIEKFSFDVKLDGENLYKPYSDANILESGINFWELRYQSSTKGIPGEKLGVLWFTFNRKVTSNPEDQPYGILVRSKNMLVGDNNALAEAMFRGKSDDYVATYRELSQTLRGVYGEMLIHSPELKDNARRDWFKVDEYSIQLRNIIANFLKLLYKYRYVASGAFNAIENDKNKSNLIDAFVNLTSSKDTSKFVSAFYEEKRRKAAERPTPPVYEYADDDLPRATATIKKFYDKVIASLRDFYSSNGDKQDFIKIRSYIKKKLSEEQKD